MLHKEAKIKDERIRNGSYSRLTTLEGFDFTPRKTKMTIEKQAFKDVFPIKHGDFPASHFRGDNQLLSFEDEANMIDIDIVPTPTSGSTWVLLKNMHTLSHFWLVVCPRTTSKKIRKASTNSCAMIWVVSPPQKSSTPKSLGINLVLLFAQA